LSAARTRWGVNGNWRSLTPVASKNAFPIAATGVLAVRVDRAIDLLRVW
jgi:hypothetical protein